MLRVISFGVCFLILAFCRGFSADPATVVSNDKLAASLIFHAPFDDSVDARVGKDRTLYTAETLERKVIQPGNLRSDVSLIKDAGRHGSALRFAENSSQVLLFKGVNSGYRNENWSGTVSFWMKLNPDQDLKPGYCDPVQMTDKNWNDASFFVDFDKDLPRVFRLGVFADYKSWNPQDTPWEEIAMADRPMVPVVKPPFTSDRWTHVAWTFENLNSEDKLPSEATLYLDGVSQGTLKRPFRFTWDIEKAVIMIGISYIGDFDDLAIFDRALTADEIGSVMKLPHGVAELVVK